MRQRKWVVQGPDCFRVSTDVCFMLAVSCCCCSGNLLLEFHCNRFMDNDDLKDAVKDPSHLLNSPLFLLLSIVSYSFDVVCLVRSDYSNSSDNADWPCV